jgi:hypothetical protein
MSKGTQFLFISLTRLPWKWLNTARGVTMQGAGRVRIVGHGSCFWRKLCGGGLMAPMSHRMKNETRRHHGAPYKLLAVAGGLILTGVVAHSAWSKTLPQRAKQATPPDDATRPMLRQSDMAETIAEAMQQPLQPCNWGTGRFRPYRGRRAG